jgi:hypothetical protein
MAVNLVWHAVWAYVDASGKLLQYPEQAADFIVNILPSGAGGDGTARPDPNDLKTRIGNNFATPSGATVALRLVSSGQCAAVYS